MNMVIKHNDAKFKKKLNPKVGLIALSTDQTIERDFKIICKFCNITKLSETQQNERYGADCNLVS